jgi:hypothetical protein
MVVFFKCNVPGFWMESPGQHLGNPAGIYPVRCCEDVLRFATGAAFANFYGILKGQPPRHVTGPHGGSSLGSSPCLDPDMTNDDSAVRRGNDATHGRRAGAGEAQPQLAPAFQIRASTIVVNRNLIVGFIACRVLRPKFIEEAAVPYTLSSAGEPFSPASPPGPH